MIKSTAAYGVWRVHSQQMLDFAIMVTTAAPQLDHALATCVTDPTAFVAVNPSFHPSAVPYSTERRALPDHQEVLGATLLLSVFSYFETYFFSAVDEMLDFHGGGEEIEATIRRQFKPKTLAGEFGQAMSKLRQPFKKNHAERFRKYSHALRKQDVVWPSQRFMLFGLKQALAQKGRWRAFAIPDLTSDLLGLQLTETERKEFHKLRDDRNKIAHGKNLKYSLQKAVKASNFFRELSLKIDQHVVENFLVVERYVHP